MGDFFGLGFGLRRNFVSLPLQMSPQDGKGFNCWFPMPFASGARFEVENQGESLVIFYYYIDYEEYPEPDPELARFHERFYDGRAVLALQDEVLSRVPLDSGASQRPEGGEAPDAGP